MNAPALVAVAHGSRDPAASHSVDRLLGEVRRQRPGLTVLAGYLDHSEPRLAAALAGLDRPAVVVPLLLTAAYHSAVDIPGQLAGARHPVTTAAVLGPHDLLLAALERRLGEAGVPPGDPSTAVALAAAGSADPGATATVAGLARSWATRGWWAVEPAFASAAEPTVDAAVTALRRRGAPRVAVASYLLSPGVFADGLHDSGADVVSAPLGAAPEVAAVVLERYDRAVLASSGGGGGHLPRR
ncbi:MAG: sirohydrochlorin chelatase [Actinomycetes bacterium]